MKQSFSTTSKILLATGGILCIWVGAAVINALSYMNWSVSELARQYMTATGMIKPLHTLVDFYTHIKGIEYLICVAFFVAFPVFYCYLNKEQKKRPALH
jgi:ABC-type bacteriocin/lantibiotic exporter with double-glycine peptidase domain